MRARKFDARAHGIWAPTPLGVNLGQTRASMLMPRPTQKAGDDMRAIIAGLFGLALIIIAAPASAQDFVSGRPGATESPIAVAPGRWQVESELASFARNDDADADALSLFETTFRYGLARSWDAELIVSPYNRVDGPGGDDSGFGDVTLRLRKTFKGLEGGPAYGVIAYLTLPTGEEGFGANEVEGGVIAAGTQDLDAGFDLTWTAGIGAASNGDDYDALTFGGVAIGYGLTDNAGIYAELFAEHVDETTSASLNFGATYAIGAETQIDAGVDFGLNDDTDDARVFIGWARRF
jgi:hypothetical protein